MSTLSIQQRRAIDLQKERLVPAAERWLDESKVIEISKNKFGDSQLRNLQAVANETESPAVVLNFIRYQIGRDLRKKVQESDGWAKYEGGQNLGERLIDVIEKGAVEEALEAIRKAEPFETSSETEQVVKIELIRHFIGFASRYLKYLEHQRAGNQNQPSEAAA